MTRSLLSLLTTLAIAVTLGCQSEPVPAAPQPAVATGPTEAQLLALLAVNADGTVAVSDQAKAQDLLGSSWPGAFAELTALNQRIRSGQARAFHSKDDLARYTRHQPTYQQTLDPSGEINYTAAATDPKNPQCRDKCDPHLSMCCCDGWFIFCWSPCGCKP